MSSARSHASDRPRSRGPRTSPTTAGWLGIIAFLFLAGLGAIGALATVSGYVYLASGLEATGDPDADPAPAAVDRL